MDGQVSWLIRYKPIKPGCLFEETYRGRLKGLLLLPPFYTYKKMEKTPKIIELFPGISVLNYQ